MPAESVLQGLDPEQRAVAEAVRGPVCVLAGAGTGKTRAITHRVAYAVRSGAVPAGQLLAVTFTTRAAGEMRGRLRALGVPSVQARTFHSAALRQLRYFWPQVVGGPPPQIVQSKIRHVVDAARRVGLTLGRAELRDVTAELEWAKAGQVRPDRYVREALRAGRRPPIDVTDVANVFAAYEDLRERRNLLDFESVLELTAAMILEQPEVASAVRSQYRHFVVDEFQDVNPLQKLLLDAWLGDRHDVCVVGDPNQTIYSFTGASPEYLLAFPGEHPDTRVIRLERDYRSTPEIVALANGVIEKATDRAPAHRLTLVAQRQAGPEPEIAAYDDERAEAAAVAARAKELIDAGTPPAGIGVLFRVNAQSEAFEQAFAELDVPYLVRGADRFFERAEVREATVLLRAAARSDDAPDRPLSERVGDVLATAGYRRVAPAAGGAARDRWESLAAIVALAEEIAAADPSAGLDRVVAELDERAATQHAPTAGGVTLASLHSAKGLEWDVVFVAGLCEGTLPIVYAATPAQLEEERRLLYVGVTRARERLLLSWARARTVGGPANREPTRFLAGLLGGTDGARRSGTMRDRGARAKAGPVPCRVCGRKLSGAVERKLGHCVGCPGDVDGELFARLVDWRKQAAQTQRVPAFVVFTDATLTVIAERRPATDAELASVAGVNTRKLARYGPAVLALVRGDDPPPLTPESDSS
ncbi:MAG: UvrD-helicase domain-containing protein [Streptosporangiales bacterium]|nr:UvrD-helicase domain-containing protein [Streptosporangiales bacterium]